MGETWIYDVEVMGGNFFDVIFKNFETKEIKTFIIFDNVNNLPEMEKFLDQEITLVGFNNIVYDNAILQWLIQNKNSSNILEELFTFSTKIISSDRMGFNPDIYKYQKPEYQPYKQIDLMKLNAFDKLGVSLKQCAINLKWHWIQDLPYEFDHFVESWEEAREIIKYNLNDVEITEALYIDNLPALELRSQVSESYGVDLTSASDSKMANTILEHYYSSTLGVDIKDIKHKRTKRSTFMLGDCIAPDINFESNFFNRIKREITSTVVRFETNWKYSKSFDFGGVHYDMGVGGLHSADFPAKFLSDNTYEIMDADVGSFYPSMMIKNEIVPEHLDKEGFIKILKTLTEERLAAKKTNKIKADSLKITINSIFGKLGSDTFWLYDPKAMLSVTVSGQLYLLMLIEDFVLAGIQVISANTDGVVCRIPISMKSKYEEICENWQKQTGFILEYTKYNLYVRQDVNNYITEKHDGEVKAKGRFLTKIDLKKGYKYPIVPIAMYNYLLKDISIEKTILNHKEILDFCMTQKAGKQFQMQMITPSREVINLQKNNRYFVSVTGNEIIKKQKENGSITGLAVGKKVTLLNEYLEKDISEWDIDYQFYIDEATKFCDGIFPYSNYLKPFEDEPEGLVLDYSNQEMRDELLYKLNGIKGLSDKTINGLVKIMKEFSGSTFLELLIYATDNSLISSKYKDLIRINYFSAYGENKKLDLFFEEFKNGVNKYSTKLSEKTKHKRLEELKKYWNSIEETSYSFREQMEFDMQILGRFNSTYSKADKRLVLVEKLSTKYSPKITTRSIKNGKEIEFKIQKKIFERKEFSEGDVLLCTIIEKKKPVKRLDDGSFIEISGDPVWWLQEYKVIKNVEECIC